MARSKVLRFQQDIPATWQEALQQYLWFKQAEGLREITLKGHKDVISLFFKRHPEAYNSTKLKPSLYAFMGEPVKPATYNIRRNYLKQFFAWGINEGFFTENPLNSLKKRKDCGRVIQLDVEILSRLLSTIDKTTFAGLRDYALILLTLDSGIRPSEAFSLMPSDVNLSGLEVCVRSDVAKTKMPRTLPVSPITAQTIKKLLASKHPEWSHNTPVFCTVEGKTLNRHSWNDRFEYYSRKIGIKIRPYDLRHAFALQFLRNGGHALALQRTLGHTDLTMTKRYVSLTQDDLKEQHALASPLNTLLPRKNRLRNLKARE
ncbi:MAG: site-specific integrase [Firmicutes bacterium]|nr:site-specific integrase [Bacillota bacterium]